MVRPWVPVADRCQFRVVVGVVLERLLCVQMGTGVPQQTTMLNWANLSERAQKIKGLNFCASQFVTEDEVKYCVAKLFSGDVKFATMVSIFAHCPVYIQHARAYSAHPVTRLFSEIVCLGANDARACRCAHGLRACSCGC